MNRKGGTSGQTSMGHGMRRVGAWREKGWNMKQRVVGHGDRMGVTRREQVGHGYILAGNGAWAKWMGGT